MKTVFVIVGFKLNNTAADDRYKEIRDAIAAKGYRVLGVPLTWKRKTISDYLPLLIDFYEKNKSEENILIGGSLGAMLAFLTAPLVKPDRVLLCSLSAFFKEDLPKQTEEYMLRKFGKRRMLDFYKHSADETAVKLNKTDVKCTFLIGEKEVEGQLRKLRERVFQSSSAVKNSKLVEVADAPHSFRHPAYIKGIVKEL